MDSRVRYGLCVEEKEWTTGGNSRQIKISHFIFGCCHKEGKREILES